MVSQVVFFGSLLKCLSNGLFLVSLGIYLALLISYMYIGILLPTPGRPRGVGHCTIQCGCCIDARGFEIQSQEDLVEVMDEFLCNLIFPDEENKTYHNRYMRAFFTGIGSERDQAPKWI